MSITIKEIARKAGTSRGTVDRVLNHRGYVKTELAELVKKIAKENNYQPNATAKLLVNSQKTFLIGVIVNSIGNQFFDDVLKGIKSAEKEFLDANLKVQLKELKGYNENEQLKAIDEMVEIGVNGIAITPVDSEKIKAKLDFLSQNGMPITFINSDLFDTKRLAMIGCDNTENGALAGQIALLTQKEKSKIVVVTGSFGNLGNKKRVNSFCEIINSSERNFSIIDIIEGHDDNQITYEKTKEILSREQVDLIYFCAGGTLGGIKALRESDVKTKAITVDLNLEIAKALSCDLVLATITQDPFDQGYSAVTIIANYLFFGRKPKTDKIHTQNMVIIKNSKCLDIYK